MEKKQNYINQVVNLCEQYNKLILVNADNVGAAQMDKVRKALRDKAVVLMGKNTLMRKGMKQILKSKPKLGDIVPFVKGNIGLVFTNDDLAEVRSLILENKVAAPAKQGTFAPVKVVINAQNTGMEPTKTSFFQALNIPTKITKGTVEILNDFTLLEVGQKVGNSEATLLQMMNVKPFSYGLKCVQVYDNGSIYDPKILDITDDDLLKKFRSAANNIAAVSLEVGYPTEASIPHSVVNSFKNLLSVAVETDYSFPQAEKIKEFLADPTKFATTAPTTTTTEEKPEEKEEEEEESESGGGVGMDLFGGDDSDSDDSDDE